jgi:hypothetical protein
LSKPAWLIARGLFFALSLGAQGPETLVLGIAGGWEPPDAPWALTARVNRLLAAEGIGNLRLEGIRNRELGKGRRLIEKMVDTNRDGKLSGAERAGARIILFGQSMGGAATLRLCRWMRKEGIPVRLNVQIDSVGWRDGVVPANVREAANLYQRDVGLIRGQSRIRAEDEARTKILGNWQYHYGAGSSFDTSALPLLYRAVLTPHVKMEFDPAVEARVEGLIAAALRNW